MTETKYYCDKCGKEIEDPDIWYHGQSIYCKECTEADRKHWADVLAIPNNLTKEALLYKLRELQKYDDTENGHAVADDLLVKYINDNEIKEAYDKIGKWYS